MFDWHPHILSEKVFSDMKPVQFMRISINDGKELKEVFDPLAFLDEEKQMINDQYNVTNEPLVLAPNFDSENKLVNFEIKISNLRATLDAAVLILRNAKRISKDIFDIDGSGNDSFDNLVVHRADRRNLYSFQRLNSNMFFNEMNQDQTPILNGLFKGTYSIHGNEIISVKYNPQNNRLEGLKLTGDENVPVGQISFYADLSKPIYMSKEEQRNSTCNDLIQNIVDETYNIIGDYRTTKSHSSFIKPQGVIIDVDNFDQSIYRSIGEAQDMRYEIGEAPGFYDSTMIPAHIVIFNCDTFGVIFLALNYMGIYSRIKEDLTAVHYEDVFTNVVPI